MTDSPALPDRIADYGKVWPYCDGARPERGDRLRSTGIGTITIQELCAAASRLQAAPPPRADGRIVAVLEYRDGSVIDVVRTAA